MATKIRLQRHGKKGKPFFHIVAADSRAKRDGRFIEKLGTYNPNTNPATIDLNFDETLKWVQTGAEMTDTARAILSYKGILYKNHLIKGIAKGALTEEQVEERFAKWLDEKAGKVTLKKEKLEKAAEKTKADKMKSEAEVSAARAKEIEAKNTPEVEEAPAEEAAAPEAEAPADAPAAEAAAPEAEAPADAPAAEAAAPEAEAPADAPAAEAAATEVEAPADAPAAAAPEAEAPADAPAAEAPETEDKTEE
jgi:small subunit ribosomal protein S16